MHALCDLETMGNGSNAPIVAIGAVKFDPYGEQVARDDDFYAVVDLASSIRIGMEPDASTIEWWLGQSDAARKSLLVTNKMDIIDALVAFEQWYDGAQRFWCHGATFDAVILANAYGLIHCVPPFNHRDVRDTRTLFELAGMDKTKTGGIEHHALDDARRHAIDVQAAYRKLALLPKTPEVKL